VYTKSLASLPLFDSTLHCTKKPRIFPRKVPNYASPSLATKVVPMKSYLRKGQPAPIPTSSSVLALLASEEARTMVRPASVSTEVVSTSSRGRPMFPSRSHPPSPRLPLLSLSPSTTMLALAAPVVPSPLPLPVHSTSPSSQVVWPPLFLVPHVVSESHVSSHSRSTSTEDMSEPLQAAL
jgi:hypothetical protein